MKRYDAVVIGAGFAGAATAWWLRRAGADRVLILEREEVPGAHASGRNAGIVRQAAEDLATTVLCARGASFLRTPPEGFSDVPLVAVTGGLLLANRAGDHPLLEALQQRALAAGAECYPVERASALAACPVLAGAPFTSALFTPGDGAADIHALLAGLLRGSEVATSQRVLGFEVSGRTVKEVVTDKGRYAADWVVLSPGAWASELAREAGGLAVEFEPRRRHLVHTGPDASADPRMPYVWSLDPPVYARHESGGWLLSPCDEQRFAPCAPPADPDAPLWLAQRLKETIPALSKVHVARTWAELRTFSPDGAFVVGQDPKRSNLFWVAGLAGHGMTASAAVGELAAALMSRAVPPVDPAPYDPKRFA